MKKPSYIVIGGEFVKRSEVIAARKSNTKKNALAKKRRKRKNLRKKNR